MRPDGVIGHAPTCTLLALLLVSEDDFRATVRSVGAVSGRSPMTVHKHLRTLRDAGLVAWEDGTQGTLRPLVRVVEFGDAA